MSRWYSVPLVFVSLLYGCGVNTQSSEHSGDSASTSQSASSLSSTVSSANASVSSTASNSSQSSLDNEAVFDTTENAVYDKAACDGSLVSAPVLQDSAKTAREAYDELNGIKLKSIYSETLSEADSLVSAYYNTIPEGTVLQDARTVFYGDNAQYYLSYDLAWTKIANNTIYIKTPKALGGLKPRCYRLTLTSENAATLVAQKVYR